MANNEITKLQRTQYSGIEYSTILEDIKNAIREDPDFNKNWDNFVESDAGRMLIEMFSWIADQLSTRIDWVANENFLSTATQRSSIIKLLKLIGYKLALPKAAKISVACTPDSIANNIIPLTIPFSPINLNYKPFTISANDNTGNTTNYEAVYYDATNDKFDYKQNINIDYTNDVNLNNLTKNIYFYEGSTRVESFTINTSDNQKIILNNVPVIGNSIAVYYDATLTELLKVNTFVDYEARTYENLDGTFNAIPYVVNTLPGNAVEIEFAPADILPALNRRPVYGKNLYIIYRVGGGTKGNIASRTINTSKQIAVNGTKVNVSFINGNIGIGGEEAETIEHAMYYGPAKLKTANKAVTKEDYDIILSSYANMLASNSIGFNNLSTSFYNKYGYYPNPLQVLNFVALKKSGYDSIPTSKYNEFKWVDLRLEDRLNENIAFNDGELNYPITIFNSQIKESAIIDIFGDGSPEEIFNYLEIPAFSEVSNNIWEINETGDYVFNSDLLIALTKTESDYISVAKIIDPSNSTEWYTVPSSGTCSFEENQYVIEKNNIHAEFYSDLNLYNGVIATSSANKFVVALDNRAPVTVSFDSNYLINGTAGLYTCQEAIDLINDAILAEYHGYTGITLNPVAFGYQRIGITGEDGEGISALWDGDEKVLAYRLDGKTLADSYGLALRIHHRDSGTGEITTEDREYVFTLDYNFNPYDPTDPLQLPAIEEDDPESNDFQSYIDIAVILNRVLNYANNATNGGVVSDVKVTLESSVDSERELGTCYDMFFRPNDAISGTDVVGVEILNYSGTEEDICELLNGDTGVYPTAKLVADYTDCTQMVSFLYQDIPYRYIKITSPLEDTYSKIEFPTYDVLFEENDIYSTLFGIFDKGSCSGKEKLSLVTNRSGLSSLGNIIYETNKFYIPTFFSLVNSFTVGLSTTEETRNTMYLSVVFSSTNSVQIGNTSEYYTSENVEYVYNTVIDEARNIVEKDCNFLFKFTKERQDLKNSYYAISPDINVELRTKPKITSLDPGILALPIIGSLSIAIDYTTGPEGNPGDPEYYADRLITADISSCNTIPEIYAALNTAFNLVNSYYDYGFVDYFYLENDKITVLSADISNGKILFDTTADNGVGARTLFKIPFEGTEPYSIPYEIITEGDFIISSEYDSITNRRKFFLNKVSSSENFPDGDFYVHYINDRRYEIDNLTNNEVTLDEDVLHSFMYPYKIIGIENEFLKPVFRTFNITGLINYDKSYDKNIVKAKLEERLREKYSTIKFNKTISKSEILAFILNGDMPEIKYVTISYFGFDSENQNQYPSVEKIEAGFDEIIILEDENRGIGTLVTGLNFSYVGI